ncbi:MAG: hypothetical protein IJS74_03535 [Clostridia bacterium]|nr:hypothetical protein [Clostridia bacterium]
MTKTEDKKMNTSLIGSTADETQYEEKTYKKVLRAVLIVCLFSIMIFSFICVFSKHNYITFGEYNYVGVAKTDKFYQTKSCDLLEIKTQRNISEIKVGDVVYYSSNVESGSGRFTKSFNNIVTLENEQGEEFNISASSVVGVQSGKICVLGGIVWFLTSIVGALTISSLLLVYVLYLTFSRINFENTLHGKELLEAYKEWKKQQKKQKQLEKNIVQIEGVDDGIVGMLQGQFYENEQKFESFNTKIKVSNQEKYKFILFNIHENLIEKQTLTYQEKRIISSALELLGKVEHIDLDIEYMLVDLLLKCKLVSFETQKFINCIKEFLNKNINREDLLNFGSIYFIMVKKNPSLLSGKAKALTLAYIKKAGEFGENTRRMAKNIIIGTIKA